MLEEEADEILAAMRLNARKRKFKRHGILISVITMVAVVVFGIGFYPSFSELFGVTQKANPIPPTSTASTTDWNMYQNNARNSGFSDYEFELNGNIEWQFQTNSGFVKSSPSVSEGVVYFLTGDQSDRRIVAINVHSGQILWEKIVDPPAETSPAISGKAVYITLRDGSIISLDKDTGENLWMYKSGSPIFSSPTIYEGVIYVTTHEAMVIALKAHSGEVLWEHDAGERITSVPAVNGAVVAFNSNSNYVHILDSKTGNRRLKYPIGFTSGSVAISEDILFVSDWTGRVRAINWTKKERPFQQQIRTFKLNLYVWGLIDSFPLWTGFTWIFERPREKFQSTPVLSENAVIVTSGSGKIFKLDAENGQLLWMFNVNEKINQSVVATKKMVMVGDSKGDLFKIDMVTGEGEKLLRVNGSISSPPVVSNGRMFITTDAGTLYSIK
ncbi:PQQ-binding-like beta-propeller repeat protein [Chloroflexi bacterium]|nr:PQQ-binding-like beta-propeller repeat protein [Chloroflexota bacterium]